MKKTYEKVLRDVLWRCLEAKSVPMRKTLESKGFKLRRIKMKYLKCKFSVASHEADVEIRLAPHTIPKREFFKCIGSVIQGSGNIYKKVPPKLRGKFYKVVVKSFLLYGVLASQELTCSKDGYCGDADAEMNV
ncbi:hypothetical protein H5410_045172 [Solanum commersonii]|uniref:Uncharacterized protein n=1 Tax=Solanum commersonii TaxID=4109 RepID=A0A9J5XAA7_SOLCO|nr:hypothetical protein H5410_045172 [Solanum commersonii]